MIPKIIHYCWFGEKPIPKILQFCIKSWQEQLPDYEFFLWDERNSDFDCEFVIQAYKEKRWAFVSDYIRLQAVYKHGGIYMDTDMLLIRSLSPFMNNDCFFVAEHEKSIGVGVFGAIKNNIFIKDCLDYYKNLNADQKYVPIPKVVTDVFQEKYALENIFTKNIFLDGLTIYYLDLFYALPYHKLFDIHNYEKYLTQNSYGVHLWFGSWHSYNEFVLLRRKEYYNALKRILRTIFIERKISLSYIKKLLIAFKDSISVKNAFK